MKKVEYVVQVNEDVKKRRLIIIILIVIIALAALILTGFAIKKSLAKTESVVTNINDNNQEMQKQELSIEKNNDILDIKNIINENTKNIETKTLVVDEIDLDYTTIYKENPNLAQGMIKTIQEGIDGSQQVIIVKTYSGSEYIGEERLTSRITKGSIDKVVEIGTGKEVYSYKVKVGDTLSVTPASLTLRKSNNTKSEKVCVLKNNDEVSLIEIKEEWYKVKYKSYIGYAQANCFVAKEKKQDSTIEFKDGVKYSKDELLKTLDFDMKLNKPSGFTLEQFKKVLSGNPADTKHVIEDNAKYFYYAEKQYNINGIYLAAMAIHEGGWGKSKIANDKKNLFGYGAYDRNPYSNSYNFETYAEGIDLVARALVKNYLNEKDTKIYDNNKATGRYYNGPTLSGVNKRYATDKNWAKATYKWMTYLYNRL